MNYRPAWRPNCNERFKNNSVWFRFSFYSFVSKKSFCVKFFSINWRFFQNHISTSLDKLKLNKTVSIFIEKFFFPLNLLILAECMFKNHENMINFLLTLNWSSMFRKKDNQFNYSKLLIFGSEKNNNQKNKELKSVKYL